LRRSVADIATECGEVNEPNVAQSAVAVAQAPGVESGFVGDPLLSAILPGPTRPCDGAEGAKELVRCAQLPGHQAAHDDHLVFAPAYREPGRLAADCQGLELVRSQRRAASAVALRDAFAYGGIE
jgi:hypothetical protein